MFDLLFLSKPLFVLSFRDWPSSALASTMQRHPSCLAAPKRVRERERCGTWSCGRAVEELNSDTGILGQNI